MIRFSQLVKPHFWSPKLNSKKTFQFKLAPQAWDKSPQKPFLPFKSVFFSVIASYKSLMPMRNPLFARFLCREIFLLSKIVTLLFWKLVEKCENEKLEKNRWLCSLLFCRLVTKMLNKNITNMKNKRKKWKNWQCSFADRLPRGAGVSAPAATSDSGGEWEI